MKKVLIVTFGVLLFLLIGCEEPLPVINKAFESNPPIAQDFSIKQLEGKDQVLFVANLNIDTLRGKLFAVSLSEDTIVLRDDGKNGDEIANDGRFSVILKDDINSITEEVKKSQNNLQQSNLILFNNRSALPVNRALFRDSVSFDFEKFQSRAIVKLPPQFFLPLIIPDPKLKEQSLIIRDKIVVEDPTRTSNSCQIGSPTAVWSFGELMRQLASTSPGSIATDAQTSTFILNWLNTWNSPSTVNGEVLGARTSIQNTIIQSWLTKSQLAGAPSGQLKLELAPFKLLAIVNRLDLRGNSGYGFSNAGEGRFVFCVLDASCNPLQFTVIFEFGINKRKCSDIKAFANQWLNLASIVPFGGPAYNTALENITKQFSQCGTNSTKPNQSSLNQLRTNEIALGSPWELREFNLNTAGQLSLTTVKQEPQTKYNAKTNNADVQLMAGWVNTNTSIISQNKYTVPDLVGTTSFLGGHSLTIFPPVAAPTPALDNVPHHWDGGPSGTTSFITDSLVRHIFSLNTCSACHGGETQTFFTHIKPTAVGTTAQLSSFLNGLGNDALVGDDDASLTGLFWVQDAGNRLSNITSLPHLRGFNDLERRAIDLANLPNTICSGPRVFQLAHILRFDPVRMTH